LALKPDPGEVQERRELRAALYNKRKMNIESGNGKTEMGAGGRQAERRREEMPQEPRLSVGPGTRIGLNEEYGADIWYQ
jgi:hypothetical protein